MATVEVSRRIAADPGRLYLMIAEVTQMDRWSPESAGARWVRGQPGEIGSRFRGRNRNGLFRWSTTCTVTAAEPGRRFGFAVTWLGMPVSDWAFDFIPSEVGGAEVGCQVRESTTDRRSRLLRIITPLGTGVPRRTEHNRRTMEQTLAALDRAATAAG
ncbi:MAG TPA: SRPBCC family protein [Kineosporiaceae bacterium]